MQRFLASAILVLLLPLLAISDVSITTEVSEDTLSMLLDGKRPYGYQSVGSVAGQTVYGKIYHIAIPHGIDVRLQVGAVRSNHRNVTPFMDQSVSLDSDRQPKQAVTLSSRRHFRQVEYVDVTFVPVLYDRENARAIITENVSFTLVFKNDQKSFIRETAAVSRVNDRFFYNEWRDKGASLNSSPTMNNQPTSAWQPPTHTGSVYKIKVSRTGIYALTRSYLNSTDWDFSNVDPNKIRLFNRGQEVPIHVTGAGDGQFDTGDIIYLYGQAVVGESDVGVWNSGDFTDDNVYWLLVGDTDGVRMGTRSVSPTNTFAVPTEFVSTERFETNAQLVQFQTQADTDLWLWKNALWLPGDSSNAVQHHNVTVPGVSSNGTFQASMRFVCRARSFDTVINPDHHVIVKLNGNTMANFNMDDYEVGDTTSIFNQSLLAGTGNVSVDVSHEVTNPALLGLSIDAVQSNWFEITYSRQFVAYNDFLRFHSGSGNFQFQIPGFVHTTELAAMDITAPDVPVFLTDLQINGAQMNFEDSLANATEYYAGWATQPGAPLEVDTPSNLAGLDAATNWLLITRLPLSSAANTAIAQLKALRQSQGLAAEIVDVTDIYDEYSHGIFTPYAIRDFLEDLYSKETPSPLQYVVLLGDADYDYKDYAGDGNFNVVPTYMVADPGLGNAFHPFAIHSFDNFFVTFDGDSIPEVFVGRIPTRTSSEIVDAIGKIVAYEQITDHSWVNETLLAADCQDAASFEPRQDTNAAYILAGGANTTKQYFRLAPWNCSDKDSDNNNISDVVEQLNAGRLITSWMGHGGFLQWGTVGYLNDADLPNLNNSARPTVMLNANCFTGSFYHAATSSLMEKMMIRPDGIVSGFGPGTYMFTFQAGPASESFFSDVYGPTKERLLGALYQHLYMDLASDERILQGMVAFGDPATQLPIPLPGGPLNLRLSGSSCSDATLAWDPPEAGSISGYNVYRAENISGPFILLNGTPIVTTSYTDGSIQPATPYYYYVTAIDTDDFEGTATPTLSFSSSASLLISPEDLAEGDQGSSYNQVLSASGGDGPYWYSIVSGDLPSGMNLTSEGVLSGTPTSNGDFSFDIMVQDPTGCTVQSFALTITGTCLFCDDFEDDTLSSQWTYSSPIWSETGGYLRVSTLKKATAIASPGFPGCSNCSIEVQLSTGGGFKNQLRVFGWYGDKRNDVELLIKEETDRILLKQRVNGTVVAKGKAIVTIVPGVIYKVLITFDGTKFSVSVDDVHKFDLPKAPGSSPLGTVGFFTKSTEGKFYQITVN